MRDSDWSRQFLLRSDWLGLIVAIMTTVFKKKTLKSLARSNIDYTNIVVKFTY